MRRNLLHTETTGQYERKRRTRRMEPADAQSTVMEKRGSEEGSRRNKSLAVGQGRGDVRSPLPHTEAIMHG